MKNLAKKNIAALLVVIGCSGALFSQTEAPESERRWGFAVGLFGETNSEITISKKISSSTMLLLGAGVSWSRNDSENEQSNGGNAFENMHRTSSLAFSFGTELRKYRSNGGKALFYLGLQPSFGLVRTDTQSNPPTGSTGLEVTNRRRTTSLGLGTTAGVEYMVLPSLSLSVHFKPLVLTWSRSKHETLPPGGAGFSVTTINKNYRIAFAQIPALVARIYF